MWALQKTSPSLELPVPPVVSRDRSVDANASRTLHILGTDAKARFLAFELQPLYDSVHLLKPTRNKIVDLEFNPNHGRTGSRRGLRRDEERDEQGTDRATLSEGHISNLVTTGPAVDCVKQMQKLKHRIDSETTLCLVHDGLGVAEELSETVFGGTGAAEPEYVLGHLASDRFRRNRNTSTFNKPSASSPEKGEVHMLPELKTRLVPIDPKSSRPPKESPLAADLISSFKTSLHLNAQLTPFHKWLHVKFQAMIFTAVVDPVCVVVGCRYDEVTQIKWGMSLIMMLLDEIQDVVAALPEVEHSPLIRNMVERESLRKVCLAKLRSMKPTPSRMAAVLAQGRNVDIDSFNGYFIRRGKQLGVPCPNNEMVVAMIKAKHGMRLKQLEESIPFEITSRPHRDLY